MYLLKAQKTSLPAYLKELGCSLTVCKQLKQLVQALKVHTSSQTQHPCPKFARNRIVMLGRKHVQPLRQYQQEDPTLGALTFDIVVVTGKVSS